MKREFDAHKELIQATVQHNSGLGMLPYNHNKNTALHGKKDEKRSLNWLTKLFNRVQCSLLTN